MLIQCLSQPSRNLTHSSRSSAGTVLVVHHAASCSNNRVASSISTNWSQNALGEQLSSKTTGERSTSVYHTYSASPKYKQDTSRRHFTSELVTLHTTPPVFNVWQQVLTVSLQQNLLHIHSPEKEEHRSFPRRSRPRGSLSCVG